MNHKILYLGIISSFISCNEEGKDERILPPSSTLPNIILVVSDDHGRDDLGCYGNDIIQTPHLDALAREGIRMTNAYCTSASCSASRSVILSGIYNHANGLYGHTHAYHHFSAYDNLKTLPVILSENGYLSANIGKYHVAPREVYKFDTTLLGNERNGVEMADHCRDLIRNTREPLFLYFCVSDPHRSGEVDEKIPEKPNRFGNREQGYEGVETRIFSPDSVIVPSYLPDTPESRAELAQYYQSVYRMDQGFGRLFEHLKSAGKWENSVIIYISDNGIAFPGAKTTLYDPGMHLPCIIKLPGNSLAGSVSNAMVNWADLTPTILDLVGILPENNAFPGREGIEETSRPWQDPFAYFQGRSFKDELPKGINSDFNEVFASHTFHEITMYYPMRVYQDRRYKLIWNIAWELPYPQASDLWESATWQSVIKQGKSKYAGKVISSYLQRPEFELYDMQNDPEELFNLSDNQDYMNVLSRMKIRIREFQEGTRDPWILKWERE